MSDKLWETIDFDNHHQVCRFLQRQSDRITELELENKQLRGNIMAVYELMKYQEHGFASSYRRVGLYHDKAKAYAKAKELNESDSSALYDVQEVKFDD